MRVAHPGLLGNFSQWTVLCVNIWQPVDKNSLSFKKMSRDAPDAHAMQCHRYSRSFGAGETLL